MSFRAFTCAAAHFFAFLNCPVWDGGCVPRGEGFPCVTFSATGARFGQPTVLTVTCWHRGPDAHARCLEMADTLLAALPESGAKLSLPGGYALLRPGSGPALLRDGEDIFGARLTLEAAVYAP